MISSSANRIKEWNSWGGDSLSHHLVWFIHFIGFENEGQKEKETLKKPQGELRYSNS